MKSNLSKLFAVSLVATLSMPVVAAPTVETMAVSNGGIAQSKGADGSIQYPDCGLDCQSH